jgi:oxygen-independent coproporphyrinogen-3 oxidase
MLSLYIHIPFCVGKCHYCGFYSTIYTEQLATEYIAALRREAAAYASALKGRTFDSVYLGGGTPTVLSPSQLEKLIVTAHDFFQISRNAEFTAEANPNTVSGGQLTTLLEGGVNRLSLGVQSFSDDVLKTLGRRHNARQAADAFTIARNAGFASIGIDLIYGVPGQTEDEWNGTLDLTAGLQPEHVSAYSLSLDEGSRFMIEAEAGSFALPGDDRVAAMYEHAVEKLDLAGYGRYEISNFSRPGFACRHNMNYWARGEYLGLGPGAWSFIGGTRYHAIADVREYSSRLNAGLPVIVDEEAAGPRQAANESVMLGLRTGRGVDLARFGRDFGDGALRQLEHNAASLREAGLLVREQGRIRLTNRGFLLATEALSRLSL